MKLHRLPILIAIASVALIASMPARANVNGPAYQALKACLANCIATTSPWTVARALCGADCLADYADSKLSFASTNGGTGSINGIGSYVMVDVPRNFLAADALPADPIIQVQWYLVRPGDVNPVSLGSGLSIGLTPASFGGDNDGFLVADGLRQSGAEAEYALYVGSLAAAPLPVSTPLTLMLIVLALAGLGVWVMARNRAAAQA